MESIVVLRRKEKHTWQKNADVFVIKEPEIVTKDIAVVFMV